jgi:hypothetical protein
VGDNYYTIKNVRYATEYMGYEADGGPNAGQLVYGEDSPINWVVSPAGQGSYK